MNHKFLSYSYQKKPLLLGIFLALNLTHVHAEALNVSAVNYPLQYFAQSIGGHTVKAALPMPEDIDPAFWSPTAKDVAEIQKADVILLNGAHYAKWLPKVSLPLSKLINTSVEFKSNYIALKSDVKHNHGSGGEHSHTGTAFTTWLDLNQAEKQAEAVLTALYKKKTAMTMMFAQNYIPLQQTLQRLDKELMQIGEALNGEALLGSHPIYQYLKRRYKLNLESVHWEAEEMPSDAQWKHLQEILLTHPAKWMLWEAEPMPKTVAKLNTLGVKSIVYNPSANKPKEGDFVSIMSENVKQLKSIVKTEGNQAPNIQ